MYGVTITEIINKLNLQNVTPEIDTDKIVVSHPDVNRPALQLTGFFEHFDNERVQDVYKRQDNNNNQDNNNGKMSPNGQTILVLDVYKRQL